MNILSWIGDLFTPAATALDKLITSDAERLELRNALEKIRSDLTIKMLEYDTKVLELEGKLIEQTSQVAIAETKSESAFTRMYRPIIITAMFVMIALNGFGYLKNPLPEIFIQVFGAAFGVLTLAPSITKMSQPLLDKITSKKE